MEAAMSAITTERFDQIAREECAAVFSGTRYLHTECYYEAKEAGDLALISRAASWYCWPEERVRALLIRYWSLVLDAKEVQSRLGGWLRAMRCFERDIK